MAKLFFVVALAMCLGASMATPTKEQTTAIMRSAVKLSKMRMAVKGDAADCLRTFVNQVLADFEVQKVIGRACVDECYDEVMALHYDVWDIIVETSEIIDAKSIEFEQCADDDCRVNVLEQVVTLVSDNSRAILVMVEEGVAAIAEEFPGPYACVQDALAAFKNDINVAKAAFTECVNA